MSLSDSDGRRSAAGIPSLPFLSIVPGANSPTIRQQAGWGYSGLPVSGAAIVTPSTNRRFVFRKRRLRARKRNFT